MIDPATASGEIGAFRRDGPDSMLAGAMAIAPALKTIRGRVHDLFIRHRRLTDEELVGLYADTWGPFTPVQMGYLYRSVGTRRNELVRQGIVCDSGERKPSSRNINVIIWALMEDRGATDTDRSTASDP